MKRIRWSNGLRNISNLNQTEKTHMNQPNTQTAVAEKKKDIRSFLQRPEVAQQVALALPGHMKADRMIRVMLTTLTSTPKLLACSQESLLSCLMRCSQYGLEPDGRHAHLIPFKETCTLIFDYKGLVRLVRNTGEVQHIHCDVVRENDEFDFCYGSGARLVHRPCFGKDRGAVKMAYAFVRGKDGEESFEIMSIGEVDAIMENSQGYQAFKRGDTKSNPWDTNPDEMAKKTAFRRLSKWLPLSFELQEAINSDDDKQRDDARFAAAKPVRATATSDFFAPPPEEPLTTSAATASGPAVTEQVDFMAKLPAEVSDFIAWMDEHKLTFSAIQADKDVQAFVKDIESVSRAEELNMLQAAKLLRIKQGILDALKGGAK